MSGSALLLVSVLNAGAIQLTMEQGNLALRVPLRGTPGVPEIKSAPGEVIVEVPDARVDRASTNLLDTGDGEGRLLVTEVSALTSRSRSRRTALIGLRLREGATLPPSRVSAHISQGVLTIHVAKEPSTKASPAPPLVADRIKAPPANAGTLASAGAAATRGASMKSTSAALLPARHPSDLALRVLPFLLGLGLIAWLLLRQRAAGRKPGQKSDLRSTSINLVATKALGKSQRLMVVEVDQRRFLLSASEPGGVSLLAPIALGEGEAMKAAPTAARGKDSLDTVFSDMLVELGQNDAQKKPEDATRGAGRPVLQLVDASPDRSDEMPRQAPSVMKAAAESVPTAPPTSTGHSMTSARADGPSSADVAGLIALRKVRETNDRANLKGAAR